jgi:hypothetical protein
MKKYNHISTSNISRCLRIPNSNSHYRIYLSRRANAYKKYHNKVRKSIANDTLSSIAAHKAWLTRELDDIYIWYKVDIIDLCNELLCKK